jgi:hypothetical protein
MTACSASCRLTTLDRTSDESGQIVRHSTGGAGRQCVKINLWKYTGGMLLLTLGAATYRHLEPLGIFWICLSAIEVHDAMKTRTDSGSAVEGECNG